MSILVFAALLNFLDESPTNKSVIPDQVAPEVTEEELAQAADELTSENFEDRRHGTSVLLKGGSKAIPHLVKITEGEDLEATSRAFSILAEFATGKNIELRDETRDALDELTKSKNRSVVRRASEILNPPELPNDPRTNRAIILNARVARIGVGANRSIKVQSNANGVKETEITEGTKTHKFVETPNEGVEVTVTEKDKKPETIKVKSLDELKEKHPEIHKVYEQSSNLRLNIRRAVPPVGLLPAIVETKTAVEKFSINENGNQTDIEFETDKGFKVTKKTKEGEQTANYKDQAEFQEKEPKLFELWQKHKAETAALNPFGKGRPAPRTFIDKQGRKVTWGLADGKIQIEVAGADGIEKIVGTPAELREKHAELFEQLRESVRNPQLAVEARIEKLLEHHRSSMANLLENLKELAEKTPELKSAVEKLEKQLSETDQLLKDLQTINAP